LTGRYWLKFLVKSKGIDKIFLTRFFALTTNVLNEINMRIIIKIDTKIIVPWRGFEHAVFFWYPEISGMEKSN